MIIDETLASLTKLDLKFDKTLSTSKETLIKVDETLIEIDETLIKTDETVLKIDEILTKLAIPGGANSAVRGTRNRKIFRGPPGRGKGRKSF